MESSDYLELSSYKKTIERIRTEWPFFLDSREKLLRPMTYGPIAEKVSEEILRCLFTRVLDWNEEDLNWQVERADLLLMRNRVKYLVLEAKRPKYLTWNQKSIEQALDQANRYAAEQRIPCLAISDGFFLYARDIQNGGLKDRLYVNLSSNKAPISLWWLSVHGIYRPRVGNDDLSLEEPSLNENKGMSSGEDGAGLLHPKYQLPAGCFAYVGDASNPRTWKLPYQKLDRTVDEKRLPKAIQSLLSNYRGAKVEGIPDRDIPDVFRRLAEAAFQLGKISKNGYCGAPVYEQLVTALKQLNCLEDVFE